MTVYVDDMQAPFRGMRMCHMLADTTEELHAMADMIGIERRFVQYPGTVKEHYDVPLPRRQLAVSAGAVEVTWRFMGELVRERRSAAMLGKCA
ncbi:DUF4031 domain-containing protein [Martelella alba]|uniref:DUF4031 domain-containing protein n=1 Tax=Martelella alba TaxID=2590451 RepID=A0A506UJ47_9HYPH|nr:DUF4031 domain-containing protein [Martelella alba]TPW33328.1 DUF4031 domain-containing protein [Martelella alba]